VGVDPALPAERLTGLHPDAKAAFVCARTTALWRDHQLIGLTSGRCGVAEQQRLFEQAIEKYGSIAEASKWVLPPADSAHVRGTAMDVRPFAGAGWLDRHGARYGLHGTFAHEWWHFEYLPKGR
jgi:LAS superfamily LD-carboxypeptidase LdcB